MHTLQDETSPVHEGFQIWYGGESFSQKIAHGWKERNYSQTIGTRLENVTNWAYSSFYYNTLPAYGNLLGS